MHATKPELKLLLGLTALLVSGQPALAQAAGVSDATDTKRSGAQASEKTSDTEEVLTLSPFVIAADKAEGYVASESVTGTRIATKLRESPMVVDVITADFLKDFGAFDLSQQIGWVANISPTDSDGSFILRGFSSTPFVDGFRRLGPLDLVDTARIEIIKGPAASIYGQTLPGGVLNYTSRKPGTKPAYRMGVDFGSEGFFRSEVSSTGPVGASKKLFYMTNIATNTRHFEEEFANQRRTSLSMQLMYKPDAQTTFNAKFAMQTNRSRDRQSIPWMKGSNRAFLTNNNGTLGLNADGVALRYAYPALRYNTATGTYTTTTTTATIPITSVVLPYNISAGDYEKYKSYIADPSKWSAPLELSGPIATVSSSWERLGLEYATIHTNGPTAYTDYSLWSGNFSGEHRWNEHVNTKFTADAFQRPYENQAFSGNQLDYANPDYPDGKVGDSTPAWRKMRSKGYSTQLDNLFTFKTGPVNHNFLVTFDFTHKEDRDYRLTTTNGTIPTGTIGTPNYLMGRFLRAATLNKDNLTDNSTFLYYPVVLPLGPRSTGVYRWNGTTYGNSTSSTTPYAYPQLLSWPYDNSTYWVPTYTEYPQYYNTVTNNTLGQSDDYGLFMSERASFFKGRITALAGARYDYLQNWYKNYQSTDVSKIRANWDEQALTYQAGITGYVTKNIIVFANKSTAYNPNMQTVNKKVQPILGYDDEGEPVYGQATFETAVMPNEESSGYEFGTRFVMLDEKFNVSISRFVIDRKNKVDSYTNEYNISEYVGSGAQRSKGYEVSFNYAITDSLQVNGAYGYNDTRYTRNTLAYLVGSPTPQNSKNNYSLLLKYSVRRSVLKGLSFTAGARYYDRSLVAVGSGGFITTNPFAVNGYKPMIRNTPLATGVLPVPELPAGLLILSRNIPTVISDPTVLNPTTGKAMTVTNANRGYVEGVNVPSDWIKYTGQAMDGSKTYYIMDGDGATFSSYRYKTNIDDNRINVYNSPYCLINFGVGYSFRTNKGRFNHTVRVNVQNAFDRFYTYGSGVLGFGREYTMSYGLAF